MTVLVVVSAVFGLAIGSFLNVVIHRVPRGDSLISPGSHCPNCGATVRPRHNLPVVGWLLLRGRCADCAAPISVRYPLVELLTAVLFVLVAVRLDTLQLVPALPAFAYFVAMGVALAFIDIEHRRLPNVIVLPSYPVIALLLLGATLWTHDWSALARSSIGAGGLFCLYLLLALIYPAGMGMGDVKLAGLVGGVLGYLSWASLALGAFAGFLLGSIAGIAMLVSGRADRRTALPFGPFMIAGVLLAIFFADPLFALYSQRMGF